MSAGSASGPTPFDEIGALIQGRGSACSVGPFLTTLSDERTSAIAAHVQKGTPMEAIGRACQQWGFAGTSSTVVRHLARRCSCPR